MAPRPPTPDRTFDTRAAAFPVNVAERGDEYVVTAELPGLRTQDIDVTVRKNRVGITADFGNETGAYVRRERPRGEAHRVVTLPTWVDERHVEASYHGGVLRVHLPKRRRGRRVDIE